MGVELDEESAQGGEIHMLDNQSGGGFQKVFQVAMFTSLHQAKMTVGQCQVCRAWHIAQRGKAQVAAGLRQQADVTRTTDPIEDHA